MCDLVVCDSVWMVGGSEISDGSDCLVYLIDVGELVLVDCGAGPGWAQICKNISSLGFDPGLLHTLILTHAHIDHIGAAARVKWETGCRVVAHRLDAPAIENADRAYTVADLYDIDLEPLPVDYLVKNASDRLGFSRGSLDLVHIPGHTPGSLAVVFDSPSGRVLFGQDVHGPFSPVFGSDLDDWRDSMQRLIELHADYLCEGHFGVFQPDSAVQNFIKQQLSSPKSMMPVPVPM